MSPSSSIPAFPPEGRKNEITVKKKRNNLSDYQNILLISNQNFFTTRSRGDFFGMIKGEERDKPAGSEAANLRQGIRHVGMVAANLRQRFRHAGKAADNLRQRFRHVGKVADNLRQGFRDVGRIYQIKNIEKRHAWMPISPFHTLHHAKGATLLSINS